METYGNLWLSVPAEAVFPNGFDIDPTKWSQNEDGNPKP